MTHVLEGEKEAAEEEGKKEELFWMMQQAGKIPHEKQIFFYQNRK